LKERSQAALLLARTAKTQEQIAKEVSAKLRGKKVSRVAVLKWQSGEAKPDDEKRSVLEALYKIPRRGWDEKPPSAAKGSQTSASVPTGPLAKAELLEQRVHELMGEVANDEGSTPVEKARVYQSCSTTLHAVMKLRGEMPMTKQKFFATDEWRRIVETIELALKPFPAASLAAARALRVLDAEAADL
jgi:hypothetical protein